MLGWGIIFLILGAILGVISYMSGNNATLSCSFILAVFSLIFTFIVSLRVHDEKKLRKNIIEDRNKHDKNIRFKQLLNEPLLQSHRDEMEKTAEFNIDSSEYKEMVRVTKILSTTVRIILIVMFAFTTFLYISLENNKVNMLHELEVAEANRLNEVKAICNQVTPELIFYNTEDEIGQLKQDLRTKLTNLGFVKDGSGVYALRTDSVGGSPFMEISLESDGANNEITKVRIEISDDDYVSTFKENLERSGFVSDPYPIETTTDGTSLPYSVRSSGNDYIYAYIKIGKKRTVIDEDFWSRRETLYFNYDLVEFENYGSRTKIICSSHTDPRVNATEEHESVRDSIASDSTSSLRDQRRRRYWQSDVRPLVF